MTWEKAIKHCEENECGECIACNIPDCRTEYEKTVLHVPCFINLVDKDLRGNMYEGSKSNLP